MELRHIDIILARKAAPLYKGTYAKDQLTNFNFKDNFAIIVNTSTSAAKGPLFHWIVIYKKKNKAIFFDSLAINHTEDPYFENFFRKLNIKKVECIIKPVQQIHSSVCGMYCLLCVMYLKKSTFSKFLKNFNSNNLTFNDFLICSLAHKHFHIDTSLCGLI